MMKGILAMTMTGLLAGAAAGASSEIHERIDIGSGGQLEVDVSSGNVTVEGHDAEFVEVDATSDGFNRYAFTLSQQGRTVRLEGRREGWLSFGPSRVRVEIRVPIDFDLDLKTSGGNLTVLDIDGQLELKTSGGKIEIEDVEGDVRAGTSGGPIRMQNVVGEVEARTSGGIVELSEIHGAVDVRSSGGSIDVRDVLGRVDARTSGGKIRIDFEGAPAGEVQTSGGSIDVEWPEQFGARLDAHTSGGKVKIDSCFDVHGTVEKKKVQAELGDGGDELKLRTSGGNIKIKGT